MIKQIYNVVGLPEIILDVVIFGRDAELYKLVLERAALFEKAMYLTLNFHFRFSVVQNFSVFYRWRRNQHEIHGYEAGRKGTQARPSSYAVHACGARQPKTDFKTLSAFILGADEPSLYACV